MTGDEKIEANANLIKWCVHVLGADDVIAAPSHAAAEVRAREINHAVLGRVSTPNDVLCFAYAAPWPYSEETHAESVRKWDQDN